MKMKVLGIDPGIKGAISSYNGGKIHAIQFPSVAAPGKARGNVLDYEMVDFLIGEHFSDADHCYIEQTQARPMEGRGTIYKFGYACGFLRGIVTAYGIPVTMITPVKWKRSYGISSDKIEALELARKMFPEHADSTLKFKKDADKAESMLIAKYGYEELSK
jgi:crossover junction endodeoxyribonuclease RuvC